MNHEDFICRFDRNQRIEVMFPRVRREETAEVVRHIGEQPNDDFVLYSRLTEQNADAVIDEQVAYFDRLGHAFEWKVYDHDRPADLKERLARRGFVIGDAEALLALDLATLPAVLAQPVTADVRRVTDPQAAAGVVAVEQAVRGKSKVELGERLAADLRHRPELLSLYIGYDGARPVSCAWTYFDGGSEFAGLWGGSTLAEYRGRGYYTALLSRRAQEARQRGVRYLIVDASPMSRPILEKHGFEFVEYSAPCQWELTAE